MIRTERIGFLTFTRMAAHTLVRLPVHYMGPVDVVEARQETAPELRPSTRGTHILHCFCCCCCFAIFVILRTGKSVLGGG